jgi:hypothetical protein
MNAWAIKGPDGTLSLPLKESDAWIGYDDTDIEYLKAQGFTCVPVTVTEIVERSPYEVMAEGNHSIGVFKDGKLIAADADVFMPPKERRKRERRIKCNRGYPVKRSGKDRRKP